MIHPRVQQLTVESDLCALCVAQGPPENYLAHGFLVAAQAALDSRPIPVCDTHRIRLSFVFDLNDQVQAELNERAPKPPR